MYRKELRAILLIIIIAVTMLFVVLQFLPMNKADYDGTASVYRLVDEDGTVKLYNENKVISIYEGIISENLPTRDRIALKKGIEFDSLEKAERAIEDYDG